MSHRTIADAHGAAPERSSAHQRLVLVAMSVAVAMTFLDQTIVALAVPDMQHDLSLSPTGTQWVINSYLLALAALFTVGGKLADVLGQRRMVTVGVAGFAVCSALCGATPTWQHGEAWLITFRVAQGGFAALLYSAALAIVVATYPVRDRGKGLALFFGASGGLTAIGPLAGGYLTEWTWRAIFWINVPIAIVALVLTAKTTPVQERQSGSIDYRGAALISAAVGLVVLGLQQSGAWGWADARTIGVIVAGAFLLASFVAFELRQAVPLIQLRTFAQRAFAVDNVILLMMSAVFVPFFFFASVYAQASLGYSAADAGLLLLVFFGGFATAGQWGGRIVDRRGARPAIVLGCLLSTIGFFLWGASLPGRDLSDQWYWIALAGAGLGLVLGPVSTDALNRAPDERYGEAIGITQTIRNLGASLGLAIMGSLFIGQSTDRIERTLTGHGVPGAQASQAAHSMIIGGGDLGGRGVHSDPAARAILDAIQIDIAHAVQTVTSIMAGIMAIAFAVAMLCLRGDSPKLSGDDVAEPGPAHPEPSTPHAGPSARAFRSARSETR